MFFCPGLPGSAVRRAEEEKSAGVYVRKKLTAGEGVGSVSLRRLGGDGGISQRRRRTDEPSGLLRRRPGIFAEPLPRGNEKPPPGAGERQTEKRNTPAGR